jgi:NAD(P)-dependent dehydrogenase (short-subunit alcohol dehydrogenase family)
MSIEPVDVLVNNIGHQCDVTDPYAPIEDWQKVVRVNFEMAVEACNAHIPEMKDRGWGRIVNIGSLGGHEQQGPWQYCAAKAALSAYTRCMGRTLASEAPGVVMSAVLPGVVVTEDGHWSKVLKEDPDRAERYLKERCPLGRFGTVHEIAPVVAFLCSDASSFAHGAIWTVDGGQARGFNW